MLSNLSTFFSSSQTENDVFYRIRCSESILVIRLHTGRRQDPVPGFDIGQTPLIRYDKIARMKAEGILKRIGPDKGGYWQIME